MASVNKLTNVDYTKQSPTMKTHRANKEQEVAFNKVIKAIKQAKAKGLCFYGKQDSLVAYTKTADNYMRQYDFDRLLGRCNSVIPYLAETVLHDSGADDYAQYYNPEDQPKQDK